MSTLIEIEEAIEHLPPVIAGVRHREWSLQRNARSPIFSRGRELSSAGGYCLILSRRWMKSVGNAFDALFRYRRFAEALSPRAELDTSDGTGG
jgi:hypothetical protein